MDTLVARLADLIAQITAAEAVLDLHTRVAPLAQLSQLNNDVSATEAKLGRLQAELTSLDKRVTDAQAVLRTCKPRRRRTRTRSLVRPQPCRTCRTRSAPFSPRS